MLPRRSFSDEINLNRYTSSKVISLDPHQIAFCPRRTEKPRNCLEVTHLGNDSAKVPNQVCLMSEANVMNATKSGRFLTSIVSFRALCSLRTDTRYVKTGKHPCLCPTHFCLPLLLVYEDTRLPRQMHRSLGKQRACW